VKRSIENLVSDCRRGRREVLSILKVMMVREEGGEEVLHDEAGRWVTLGESDANL